MIAKLTHTLAAIHWSAWLAMLVFVAYIAHHLGYWYGRTYQIYEDAKSYGSIPKTTTWSQFLKGNRP